MNRTCVGCSRDLPQSSYTARQWSLSPGVSRCATCFYGHHLDGHVALCSSGRYNNSNKATFTQASLATPFAQGKFRWVAKGSYTDGERNGQECVGKWFKTGSVFSNDYFALDIKAVDKALVLAEQFNQARVVRPVKINVATVWVFEEDAARAGEKLLTEPFIPNYRKFNSNTGWSDESTNWSLAMQAMSHFTYHNTNGSYVLCDLQGGFVDDTLVLSDPVILSRNREYGVTDLGPKGISSFFSSHVCNAYCRREWTRPINPQQYYEPEEGTSMLEHTGSTQTLVAA